MKKMVFLMAVLILAQCGGFKEKYSQTDLSDGTVKTSKTIYKGDRCFVQYDSIKQAGKVKKTTIHLFGAHLAKFVEFDSLTDVPNTSILYNNPTGICHIYMKKYEIDFFTKKLGWKYYDFESWKNGLKDETDWEYLNEEQFNKIENEFDSMLNEFIKENKL